MQCNITRVRGLRVQYPGFIPSAKVMSPAVDSMQGSQPIPKHELGLPETSEFMESRPRAKEATQGTESNMM